MLTPVQAAERAADLVARARAAGADAADAVFAADAALAVQVRMGALEDVGRSESAEIGLRAFVGNRSATVATSDLSSAGSDALVARVVAMAQAAPEDPWAGLAPRERLARDIPDLDIDDGGDATPEALKERALAVEDAARAVAGVTLSDGGSASASRTSVAIATSDGFAHGYSVSGYGLSATMLAGAGGAMERDYASHSARHQAALEAPELVGRRAGERTVARLGAGRVTSGAMPVVFDPRVAGGIVGHLLGAIAGAAIARRTSFLLDALDTRVFAPGVTIVDDPLRPRGLRSRPFDGEGLAVAPTRIVEDGVLATWLLDSASARQLGRAPTGHAARGVGGNPGASASNVALLGGSVSPAAMIGDIARGVYVVELIGQGVNGVTGDYSRGAVGILIENGELTRPVSEFTIASNLRAMFAALTPADDLEYRRGVNAPTLRIDGMTVAGG